VEINCRLCWLLARVALREEPAKSMIMGSTNSIQSGSILIELTKNEQPVKPLPACEVGSGDAE
jgi:hypothetical protein